MITIAIKTFKELSTEELYSILQLRSEVFVVEQNCVYQDIDFKDQNALEAQDGFVGSLETVAGVNSAIGADGNTNAWDGENNTDMLGSEFQ